MNEFTSRQYSNEQVNRIIRRALKLNQESAPTSFINLFFKKIQSTDTGLYRL